MLILVDFQVGFLKDAPNDFIQNVLKLAQEYRPAVATQFMNAPDSLHRRELGFVALEKENETALHPELAKVGLSVIKKSGYSSISKEMIPHLETQTQIYLAGCDTDACILATAFALWDRNIVPKIIMDACWSRGRTQGVHEAALLIAKRNFGANSLVTTKDLLNSRVLHPPQNKCG